MWNKHSDIPPVITVFSAPNYCGNCGNKGAILKINVKNIQYRTDRSKSNKLNNKNLRNISFYRNLMYFHGLYLKFFVMFMS